MSSSNLRNLKLRANSMLSGDEASAKKEGAPITLSELTGLGSDGLTGLEGDDGYGLMLNLEDDADEQADSTEHKGFQFSPPSFVS